MPSFPVHIYIYVCIYLYLYLYLYLRQYPYLYYIYSSLHICLCLSISLSLCLSVCLSISSHNHTPTHMIDTTQDCSWHHSGLQGSLEVAQFGLGVAHVHPQHRVLSDFHRLGLNLRPCDLWLNTCFCPWFWSTHLTLPTN